MIQTGRSRCWQLGVASYVVMGGSITLTGCFALSFAGALWAIASLGDCALAQIIPDTTLGSENSTVTPITPTVDQINGGATRGTNLFHSFQEFNIGNGRSVFFSNPAGIENILTRVTGANPSNILGTLGVNGGNANLFLINPNGIIFGQNARLDVGGSFVATTANAIGLANGDIFSTNPVEPLPNQLLNVNPNAFLFNQIAAQPIINHSTADSTADSTGLKVHDGQSLLLVGGDVRLEEGRLTALGGRIELGGVSEPGTVGLTMNDNTLSLTFPANVVRADASLTNGSIVNVAAGGGGSIAINARNLNVLGRSRILAGIGTGLGSVSSQAGDIEMNATGAIAIEDSYISNLVRMGAIGNGGDINIQAGALTIRNGAQLATGTFGQGNGGSVKITATDTVSFNGGNAFSRVGEGGEGKGGNIVITAESLTVRNGAQVAATTRGQGNGGSVKITATDIVSFDGGSGAFSTVEAGAEGKGGDIVITTGSLAVTDSAFLDAANRGQGNGGSVRITATDTVFFDRGFAVSTVGEGAKGNGGDIVITTGSLTVRNRAGLSASTFGQGDAGSVRIRATDTVSFDRSGAFSTVIEGAEGKGGDIVIATESLTVRNRAGLSVSTFGQGDAGSVRIIATDTVSFNGGSAFSTVEPGSKGKGGDIVITTGSLAVTDNAFLDAATLGQGDAGSVRITATDTVSFYGDSAAFSTVEAGAEGNGGDIEIKAGSLSVTNGAVVTVSSSGNGAAGNIVVEASSISLDNQGMLQASTASVEGGNIKLRVQDLILMRRSSLISARAYNQGNGGNITINAPFIVAVPSENSDIVADAFRGRGGNISITSQGIYGLEYRQELTPESDINASSEFGVDGTVEINSPDVDPSRGLVNLPVEPANLELAQSCQAGDPQAQSSFVVTGRGGLPPSPREALSADAVEVDLVRRNYEQENRSRRDVPTNSTHRAPTRLVEAQGWVMSNNGEVILTATAPTVTPHNSWQPTANCFVR